MSLLLFHGLGRGPGSMYFIGRAAQARGMTVHRPGYPSLFRDADSLVAGWVKPALAAARGPGGRVDVITHSLGGILLRLAIGDASPDWLGNVVLITPPNGGSQVVDFLEKHRLSRVIGPTGRRLGTGPGSLASVLPPVRFHCGVIAADRNFNPLTSKIMPGPHDGAVALSATRAEGVAEYRLVHTTHSLSLYDPRVIRLALDFIETGRFPDADEQRPFATPST